MKWQQRYRIDWDASDGRLTNSLGKFGGNGAVQISSGRRIFGSGGVGSGPGEGFRARQPPCGLGLGDALQLANEDLAGAFLVF